MQQLAPILSADPSDGIACTPTRRTVVGTATTGINQLLVVTNGGGIDDSEPGRPVNLRIIDADGFRVVDHALTVAVRAGSRACVSFVPVRLTFSKVELVGGGITLNTTHGEPWQPESFYVFGLFRAPSSLDVPIVVVPLLSIPIWTHAPLSTAPLHFDVE